MRPITVREKTDEGWMQYDLFSRLNEDRIIMLDSDFNDTTGSLTVAQLKILSNQDPEEDIIMWINSPGGSVSDGLAIYDTMQTIPNTIQTFVIGHACSMGAFILSSGSKGHRYALPNASIMIHQVSSGTRGTFVDQRISLDHTEFLNNRLAERMAVHCGKTKNEILQAIDRDNWLTPEGAKAFGLVDHVVEYPSDKPNKWGSYKEPKKSKKKN